MAVAIFDYTVWAARYPALAADVDEAQANELFADAGLYLDNTDGSIVADPVIRLRLLNMVVAHLATLEGAGNGGQPSGGVGRVSSATEGSVSANFDTGLEPGTAAWWNQTSYGFSFWAATKRYRSMHYRPGPRPIFNPPGALWRR